MVSIQDTMNEISNKQKIKETQNKYNITHKEAKIYLSSLIFTRCEYDEEEYHIKKLADELQNGFSQERLENYALELENWKRKEVISKTEEFELTLQDLNQVQSPSDEWNSLFDGQRRLVGFAHRYFNSLKQRIENALEEDHEKVEQ